jgi:ATP-dependent DNA helicase RecQ
MVLSETYDRNKSLELLRIGSGLPNADFRDGQDAAIRHVVEGAGRLLVVQKTGWGKSFVYFIATKLLRDAGHGPTLLISPLLALMRNQILAAERMGVRAVTINSENREEWGNVEKSIDRNEIDVLLISPERLANERFRTDVLQSIYQRVSLLVVDEAHCISDWGHDFRPHYRLLEQMIKKLPVELRILATTATANDRVVDDLHAVLGPNLGVSRGELSRPSLSLQTIRLASQAERLAWLAEQVPLMDGHGIIYTLTIRDAEMVAKWLKARGMIVESYSGDMVEGRAELEQALLDNELKALVSTTALGMGFDKPDLAFVIHYQTPGSVVAYYQQVGRAGRALEAARGVLLSGQEETDITNYFIETAFPTRDEVEMVLSALDDAPAGLSIPQLLGSVNLSMGRVIKTTELLSLESPAPIHKEGIKWNLTSESLSESFWQRAERLTDLRREEQTQMQEYVSLKSGHMQFLIDALDGDPTEISSPDLEPLGEHVSDHMLREAIAFLRRTSVTIEPRKRWPRPGGLPEYRLTGNIKRELQAEPGKSLSIWGDSGWGTLVRQGKYQDRVLSEDLVDACVILIQDWDPQPYPLWVTNVPSIRNPALVADFTERLSEKLELPYRRALNCTGGSSNRVPMANSVQRARNLDGSLTIVSRSVHEGPVLLLDDLVDTGWTMTIGSWLLRSNGSGPVFPLALALMGWR